MKEIFEALKKIRVNRQDNEVKPHKYALLLAIAKTYDLNPDREERFTLEELEPIFRVEFNKLADPDVTGEGLIEHPFYHLQSDGIWQLRAKTGKEQEFNEIKSSCKRKCKQKIRRRFTKRRLLELVDYACLTEIFAKAFKEPGTRKAICETIERIYSMNSQKFATEKDTFENKNDGLFSNVWKNSFVDYLGSLQRVNGANENALAESQSCNPHFKHIFVQHPLSDVIRDGLTAKDAPHIILTGHAGDGKTTLAVDVYKRLKGLPDDEPLTKPLLPKEDLENLEISIIKDLSERDQSRDQVLIQELFDKRKRFLIVSNTGTLLNLFNQHSAAFGLTADECETMVLGAISDEQGEAELKFGDTGFRIFNLARIDNLGLAQKIFEKMLAKERWQQCFKQKCAAKCPLLKNVELLQKVPYASERIFLTYRRMYEYGVRLTIRQLTEHLAYMITSGLSSRQLEKLQLRPEKPIQTDYLFFNRFYGDDGKEEDLAAKKMKAVYEIARQGFGQQPCPTWERRLWLRSEEHRFPFEIAECEDNFEQLRRKGAGIIQRSIPGLSPDRAREQVRRMLYFLYDFDSTEESFLTQYLNSVNILRWQKWQSERYQLESSEKTTFDHRIYHVLQEHFTGVRLPEGRPRRERRLYLTLNRRRSEIRQSAQLVLAGMSWPDFFKLELLTSPGIAGVRRDLTLTGRNFIDGLQLRLALPFLDYVVMRHFGELGEVLQTAYLDRLERFKAQILLKADNPEDRITLVRLRADNTFRRQELLVNNDRLEVCSCL